MKMKYFKQRKNIKLMKNKRLEQITYEKSI